MPKRKKRTAVATAEQLETAGAPVRSFWSGTITFGLVSIPVELLSAVRPRQTAMKLIDKDGHPLGRQYHCSKDDKTLSNDDLVRGYETDSGKMVVITDDEFEAVAPEMSGDIELRNFVPLEQIPPMYFQRPYFLAPSGKSAKAYLLLAATMARTGKIGIGSFVMRGHEYLVAIVSDNGVLRADTLRYGDEVRAPQAIGLPKATKGGTRKVDQLGKEIDALTRDRLDVSELEDDEAKVLLALVKQKEKDPDNVIHRSGLEDADADDSSGGAKIIDLMAVLRKSLSKNATVTNAQGGPPIDLAERRALKHKAASKGRPNRKPTSRRKASRSKTRRA